MLIGITCTVSQFGVEPNLRGLATSTPRQSAAGTKESDVSAHARLERQPLLSRFNGYRARSEPAAASGAGSTSLFGGFLNF